MRAQAGLSIGSKIPLGKMIERAAQMRQVDAAIDNQSFKLMKHRQMRDIRLAAIGFAERDHANGRPPALHFVPLGVRSVRRHDLLAPLFIFRRIQKERLPVVAGRMIRGKI